jgi:ribonucleotide monophosphatase NagD (HAD superfamily)
MVGDDIETDVGGGRRAGLRTAFVLSGKHGETELAAARRRGHPTPDYVAASLAELVGSLS